jgi:hypothetical protein
LLAVLQRRGDTKIMATINLHMGGHQLRGREHVDVLFNTRGNASVVAASGISGAHVEFLKTHRLRIVRQKERKDHLKVKRRERVTGSFEFRFEPA